MASPNQPNFLDLHTAIIREPPIVAPDITAMAAIAAMASAHPTGPAGSSLVGSDNQQDESQASVRSSCVLVVEDGRVLGILTERDIVRLSAQQRDLEQLTIREVMTQPVVTLRESQFTDLFATVNLIQQQQIRHLPLVDEGDRLVGLLTHESLRRLSQPIDLMRFRRVEEVMTRQVVRARAEDSMLAIAQLMAQHRVSSVVIVEPAPDQPAKQDSDPLDRPIGLITERDLVQFQALGLSLATCPVAMVMSTPVFTVLPEESLLRVQQVMQRHLIHRLVVTAETGELLGIVTQTTLLNALNPLELYKLVEILETRVQRLEADQISLLENRNAALEQQVAVRTATLEAQAERERLIGNLATQIRSSLNLQTILDTTVEQVRQILGCDRVNIWQLQADGSTVAVAESTESARSLLGECLADACFEQGQAEAYRRGKVRVVRDVDEIELSDGHREFLRHTQTRAKILVPLLCGDDLWGLLNVSETSSPRDWQSEEVDLLQSLGIQLAIALQQATHYEQLQVELEARRQTEAQLCASEKRYASLVAASPVGILHADLAGICTYANDRYCEILGIELDALIGQPWHQGHHPDDLERINQAFEQALQEHRPLCIEYRIQHPNGTEIWVYGQAVVEYDDDGQMLGYVGTITDISDRKRTEFLVASQHQVLEQIAKGEPLTEILNALLQVTEFHLPDTQCSILLCEEGQMRFAAAPSLPAAYCEMTNGAPIGEGIGSCGTAAFRKQMVIVADIETDPLWQNYKHFALAHNLRACWSAPILGSDQSRVIGIFGIYYQDIRTPKNQDLERLRQSANIAGIAIERSQTLRSLQELNRELENRVAERTAELQVSEERWQLASQAANTGVWEWHPQTDQLFVSPQLKEMRGYGNDELSDCLENWMQLVHPDDRDRVCQAIADHLAGNTEGFELEYRVQHKEGSYLWILSHAQAQWDASGQPVRIIGAETDITQRKQAELALQASQARFERMTENVPGMIYRYVLHPDGRSEISYVSSQVREIYELEPREVLDNPWCLRARIHPDDLTHVDRICGESKTTLQHFTVEHRLLLPQKGLRWIQAIARPERLENGDIIWDGIAIDISDRKATEQELLLKQNYLQALLDNIPHLAWIKDEQSRFIAVNQPFAQAFGTSTADLIGKTDYDISSAELAQAYRNDDFEVLRSGQRKVVEEQVSLANAGIGLFETTKTPFRDGQGKVAGTVGIAVNITDRKQYEQQLQVISERLEIAIQSAQIGVWEYDFLTSQLTWDDRMFAIYGVQSEDFSGTHQDWESRVHPDDLTDALVDLTDTSNRFTREFRIIRPDGSIRHVFSSALVQRDNQEKLIRCVGVNLDITEQKRSEQELSKLSERLELATQSAQLGIWEWDAQGDRLSFNDQMFAIYGLDPVSFGGHYQAWLERVHPDDLSQAQPTRTPEQNLSMKEFRIIRPDGQIRHLFATSLTQHNDQGELVRMIGTNLDISDRKQAELSLEQEILRRTTIFNASSDGIHILDSEANLLEANANFFHMLGYTPEEGKHFNVGNWEACLTCQEVQANLQSFSWDRHRVRKIESVHRRKDGSLFPAEIYICRMEWNGAPSFLCISRDISDRKKAELQLQQTNEELARATRLKDEFLANMSHELRTPLNVILGMAEGLQDQVFGSLNERQLRALKSIEKSGNHLLELITDILDLSKIEAGQIELNNVPTNISALCQSSLLFVKQQAMHKRIQLRLDLVEPLPQQCLLDERRIRQVLINLLSNAVKFTPNGGRVILAVQYNGDENQSDRNLASLRFSITDTGIGIAAEYIPRLFRPFVQIDSALNRQYSGTGLGLALVKRLVELHGGTVELTSEVGVGSCFVVDLPCREGLKLGSTDVAGENTLQPTVEDVAGSANRPLILLAEDNEANCQMLSTYLDARGFRVVVAANGEEAIAKAKSESPSLILMDIQMPKMDGLEAMRQIRQDATLVNLPIIALTALAMEGDRERCLAAGASDYLSKPVNLRCLTQLVQQWLNADG